MFCKNLIRTITLLGDNAEQITKRTHLTRTSQVHIPLSTVSLLQEEQANQTFARYRKTVHELDDAEERAGMAETALNKLRTRHRVAGKGITSVEIIQVSKTGSSKTLSEE